MQSTLAGLSLRRRPSSRPASRPPPSWHHRSSTRRRRRPRGTTPGRQATARTPGSAAAACGEAAPPPPTPARRRSQCTAPPPPAVPLRPPSWSLCTFCSGAGRSRRPRRRRRRPPPRTGLGSSSCEPRRARNRCFASRCHSETTPLFGRSSHGAKHDVCTSTCTVRCYTSKNRLYYTYTVCIPDLYCTYLPRTRKVCKMYISHIRDGVLVCTAMVLLATRASFPSGAASWS